jgi:ketosteroid isomerase-like protein
MTFMPWLLALFILVGGGQPTESPATIVARQWAQYAGWISHRDVESLANLFADNARIMEPGIDDIIGRPAIRSMMTFAFSQRVRTVDVRMMPSEVKGYDGVIYDYGNYVETMAPQDSPRQAVDVYGRYLAVWAQQVDGTWKIARLMRSPKKQPSR